MKKVLVVVFALAFSGMVAAENHEGGNTGDVLADRWADPTQSVYNLSCSTTRQGRDDDGKPISVPVHDWAWYGFDYATFLVGERLLLLAQKVILDGWQSVASGEDPDLQQIFNALDAAASQP